MIVSFDTNVLVYATAPESVAKGRRARDVIARGLRAGESVLLLQTLAEFANVAIRKAGIPVDDVHRAIDAWRAVLPVRAAEAADLAAALGAVTAHRMAFRDALLWAAARRVGVRYLLTEDLQDGFELDGVRFVDPFVAGNDGLIDEILPRS
jgi:predicted nucleic acid-binding protein